MRAVLAIGLLLTVFGTAGMGQQLREWFHETAEPPLADAPNSARAAPKRDQAGGPPWRFVDSPAPVVQVSVRAPASLASGSPAPVTLTLENVAKSPAQNVTVFYPLPAGATVAQSSPEGTPVSGGIAWKLDTLAAAARKEISFSVVPAPGSPELTHKPRVGFEYEHAASSTRFAKADIKVRKHGPDQALKHDILVFSVDVTNAGGAELSDVVVVDALPEGLEHRPDDPTSVNQPPASKPASEISPDRRSRTFKLGRLPAGQSRRLEYYVAAVNALGAVAHGVAVSAPGLAEPVKAESRVALAEPKLELTAESQPRRPANQPARVSVKLTNRSIRALANIVVTDRMSGGPVIDSVSAGGQSFGSSAQWIVPILQPNESRQFEAVVRCTQGGRVAHQVSAVYRGLSQGTETATDFDAVAALQSEFRTTHHAVELNGEVQYTLVVQNLGSAPASNVRPAIMLPAELKVVKSSPAAATDGGRASFDAATVPPGGRLVCTVTAKAVQTAVDARVVGEVAADALTAGALRKQEIVTIGRNDLAVPTRPVTQPPLPTPAPPPKKP